MRGTRLAPLAVAMLVTQGCGDPAGAAIGEWVPFEEILAAEVSAFEQPAGLLITDVGTWAAVWDEIVGPGVTIQPPLPDVDFDAYVLLFAAAGWRGGQGVFWAITEVRVLGETFHVAVREHWPYCGSLPAPSAPVHVVKVPRIATAAEFTTTLDLPVCS